MVDKSTLTPALLQIVVCPLCKSPLARLPHTLVCTACSTRFDQQTEDVIDLLPPAAVDVVGKDWAERQLRMEEWYAELLADPAVAHDCFKSDYEPFAQVLARMHGTILDVGGGVGIARHYLPEDATYLVLDPSLAWRGAEWSVLANRFPHIAEPLPFVRGVGEYLPFPGDSFDAVLSFWSLNHVSDPGKVLAEICRVLRPGGQCLLVLEDMTPRRADLARIGVLKHIVIREDRSWRTNAVRLARAFLLGPNHINQEDHIPLREADLRSWAARCFSITRRAWTDRYLSYQLQKRIPSVRSPWHSPNISRPVMHEQEG